MKRRFYASLAALFFVACSSSTQPTQTQGTGGEVNGGSTSTGGAASGGVTGSGGNAGSGGTSQTGGAPGTGGSSATGGTTSSGGATVTGGRTGTGGSAGSGGTASSGGAGLGGTTAAGGGAGSGGTTTTGGVTGAGGKIGSGGAATDGGPSPGSGGASTDATSPGSGGASPDGGSPENAGAACGATSAALLSAEYAKLPNPFAMHDGTIISTKAQWECRRNEILQDIYKYEIGPKPDPSTATVKATLSGTNLSVLVTTSSGSLTIKSAVTGSGSCVVIATDMDLNIVTGCTKVLFSTADVIPYAGGTGSQSQSDPFYKLYPSLWGKIGNYNAWSWGVSRLIDGLDQVKDQLKIDMTKIATHGCSYAGKMSLFAGALDERVALTIVEESGGGGIDSWRASADFTKRTGVSVEKIDNTNFAWFMSSMKSLDPYKLPHDHHELIAAIAPRATIILGNPGYQWLGDESGYKSTMAAVEVFKALGVPDSIGYDFTGGHAHCSAPTSQVNSINAFATKFLKGGTASTNIAIKPSDSTFQLTADFDWTTPTLQ